MQNPLMVSNIFTAYFKKRVKVPYSQIKDLSSSKDRKALATLVNCLIMYCCHSFNNQTFRSAKCKFQYKKYKPSIMTNKS